MDLITIVFHRSYHHLFIGSHFASTINENVYLRKWDTLTNTLFHSTILTIRKPNRLLRRSGEPRLRDAQRQYQSSLPQSPPRSAFANPLGGPIGLIAGL